MLAILSAGTYAHYLMAEERNPVDLLPEEQVKIPMFSVFVGHELLQHLGRHCRSRSCLQ